MASDDSVTRWIVELREGNADPGAQVHREQYFEKLGHFPRKKLQGLSRRVVDQGDTASSGLQGLCEVAPRGYFPNLADRGNYCRYSTRELTTELDASGANLELQLHLTRRRWEQETTP